MADVTTESKTALRSTPCGPKDLSLLNRESSQAFLIQYTVFILSAKCQSVSQPQLNFNA